MEPALSLYHCFLFTLGQVVSSSAHHPQIGHRFRPWHVKSRHIYIPAPSNRSPIETCLGPFPTLQRRPVGGSRYIYIYTCLGSIPRCKAPRCPSGERSNTSSVFTLQSTGAQSDGPGEFTQCYTQRFVKERNNCNQFVAFQV